LSERRHSVLDQIAPDGPDRRKRSSKGDSVPIRSCAGCGERDEQRRLDRFMLDSGRLAWDRERRRGGRGGYLHARPECFAAFVSRKPFLRSLRASVATDERARLVAERALS
jgi:uncharacterized protein